MSTAVLSPCRAHIDLDAIRRNLRRLGQPQHIMPVVKADAYGHGLLPVARALAAEGVEHFAVGVAQEGLQLRQAGFGQTIVLLMGAATPAEMSLAAAAHCVPLLHSFPSLERAVAQARPGEPFRVALKLETGMGRLGFLPEEIPALLEALRAAPGLRPVLALSHLSCADMPEKRDHTLRQAEAFRQMSRTLKDAFPAIQRSLANSAGSLAFPELRYDLFRPGLLIYGCNPFQGTAAARLGAGLEPAMSVEAVILQVREAPAGQTVSYGATYVPETPVRLAVLALGYADGFPRALSGRVQAVINGVRAPLRGRVCMGMVMADVSALPVPPREGDSAWMLGGPYAGGVTACELADACDAIPYELLCALGKNPRCY